MGAAQSMVTGSGQRHLTNLATRAYNVVRLRIIKKSTVREFWREHPDARPFLEAWLVTAQAAEWQNLRDVRRDYPHADGVQVASGNTVTVFNVAGNKYRMVVSIKYRYGVVYIRDFLTHADYSKDTWKQRH